MATQGSEPMRVLVVAENAAAREFLLADDDATLWDEDNCQIAVRSVTNASTALGGGVHLHRPESDDDLIYPPLHAHRHPDAHDRDERVEPQIEIISAIPYANIVEGSIIDD